VCACNAMPDPNLRILILSTPKTGNTWLRYLLAGVYRLPQFYVPPGFDYAALDRAGDRWVTHYHIRPNPQLIAWIRERRPVVITTIRHPGDVLISLYHHLHNFRAEALDPDFLRAMLSTGFDRTNMVADSTGQPFSTDLAYSIEWMASEGTHVVRYEDLRADPAGTLRELTSRISAVPDERIEAAVEMSDLALMRAMAGPFGGFFREGRIGGWRDLLPTDVIEMFRSMAPYAAQMAALGYSMDAADPTIARTVPSRPRHPMATLERFETGVPVVPILIQCFFWAGAEQRAHWERQLAATGPSSFYDWLNLPCSPAGRGLYEELPLSNLAAFVYHQRPDVRLVYPDLTTSDRCKYAQWFLRCAETEYGLDRAFVDPVRAGLLRWANKPCPADGRGLYQGLPVSNLAAFLYDQSPDVKLLYPDLTSRHRYEFLQWFLRFAMRRCGLDASFLDAVRAGLLRWANARTRIDGAAGGTVTNFVLHICQTRTNVLANFPHIRGRDRRALVRSVIKAARALQMDPEYVRPLEESLGRHWLPKGVSRRLRLYE